VLAFAGVRSALFLEPPTAAMLERFEGALEAVGVAGDSRAMTPDEMQQHLPAVFDALAALGAPILHYKVCSTFDSGPAIGSIGRVMQIARARFPSSLLPIVAATPRLSRWCLFGHLFARSGTDGQVYRLDRHPIMSVHPVTPMRESELARHLGQQCGLAIGSLPFDRYDLGTDAVAAHLDALRERKVDAVVLDAAHDGHMTQVGGLLESEARRHDPLFVVGSSGVEYALTQWWARSGPERGAPDQQTGESPGFPRRNRRTRRRTRHRARYRNQDRARHRNRNRAARLISANSPPSIRCSRCRAAHRC
jgi:uncharacterized protein YgbK (DUF1537 family)